MNRTEEANDERHYLLLVVAIVIGIVGVYFRFAADPSSGHPFFYNCVANILLVLGVLVALKAIFAILK
ncbi:MAG: hypothetical protein ACHQHN_02680 [Sphingobacteriales bacterium]